MGFIASTLHHRLRSLNLSASFSKDVLDAINLPSLEEWTQSMKGQRLPTEAMLSFLQRSGCCLKVLNLDSIFHSAVDLDILFRKIPSPERIRVSYCSVNRDKTVMDEVLDQIFYSPKSFLPHLQFIECKMEDLVAPFS